LAFAAYQGSRSGEGRTGSQLLAVARKADPEFMGSLRDILATAHLLMLGGDIFTAHKLLVAALRSHAASGDSDDKVVTEALQVLSVASSLGSNDELWNRYRETVDQLTQVASEAVPIYVVLNHTVLADPARATSNSLQQLEHAMAGLHNETDPARIVRIANSARYVDRVNLCREPLQRIVQESTSPGEVEASALRDLALDCFLTGQWDESAQHAHEGIHRVAEQQHWLRGWRYRYVLALLAGARGDDEANRALCEELTSWAVRRGVLTVQYASLRAGALAAIGRGDFEQAYRFSAAVSPPGQFASHNGEALFACMDLVEAAVHTNRRDAASAHVAAMQDGHIAELSPRLALVASGSAALTSPDNVAAEWFERALAVPDAERWPFDRARVQLAYGEHLRRTRSKSSSRDHLSAALDVFMRLGAHPWAKRAGNELRATGHARLTEKRLDPALTPQEREIAKLAASGMSNKQIAERLYLSHRTVANHLHRIFPKLGISSRAGLRDALISDR
jgi:DNA-binding CsgD family transcriptional regulator